MFAEEDELLIEIDDFLFTTEAHLVPLDLDDYVMGNTKNPIGNQNQEGFDFYSTDWKDKSCPSLKFLFNSQSIPEATKKIRDSVGRMSEKKCEKTPQFSQKSINLDKLKLLPLRAQDFVVGRTDHINILKKMGISLSSTPDGRVQLIHKTNEAFNYDDAEMGILFMTDMLEHSKNTDFRLKTADTEEYRPLYVILLSNPSNGSQSYQAGPAQFGIKLRSNLGYFGKLILSEPIDACTNLTGSVSYYDKILVAKRGNCMFVEKARIAEKSGAIGLIIVDNSEDSSYSTTTFFAMSGDGVHNVKIPSVFLFGKEGYDLMWNMRTTSEPIAFIGDNFVTNNLSGLEKSLIVNSDQLMFVLNLTRSRECLVKDQFELSFKISNKYFECPVDDYEILRDYFEIFNLEKKISRQNKKPEDVKVSQMIDKDNKIVHRVKIDETIEIQFKDDEIEKKLIIDLNPIIQMIDKNSIKNEQNENDYAMSIFAPLIKRFEEKTNLLKLKKSNKFKKILFKYVISKLFPAQHEFAIDDERLLNELAKNLDLI